jgi:transposase
MIRIRLKPEEREELERAFKGTPDRRLRGRCQAVLMADRGRPRRQIAEDLGVHRASVHRWLRAYQARGLAGLRIKWAAGPPPRIPEERAATILTWVRDGPQGCGLERANWTYAELAAHLYHVHGIEVRETAMRAFCRRHGVRPYRPTYRYLRGDPERQEAARRELEGLKKSRAR